MCIVRSQRIFQGMEIKEMPLFTKWVLAHMSDDEYASFQNLLIHQPERGDVIPGSGGLRKIRCSVSGRGKRGGARVIYYLADRRELILLVYAYTKNEQGDLTRSQIRTLRALMETEFK